mmetsp:Transcript_3366/g.7729  ORF Transcript_3366/g.7729 Transcript_3366/m.7729 type:complete len:249 (+) Transcript_3366:1288-2034(+)
MPPMLKPSLVVLRSPSLPVASFPASVVVSIASPPEKEEAPPRRYSPAKDLPVPTVNQARRSRRRGAPSRDVPSSPRVADLTSGARPTFDCLTRRGARRAAASRRHQRVVGVVAVGALSRAVPSGPRLANIILCAWPTFDCTTRRSKVGEAAGPVLYLVAGPGAAASRSRKLRVSPFRRSSRDRAAKCWRYTMFVKQEEGQLRAAPSRDVRSRAGDCGAAACASVTSSKEVGNKQVGPTPLAAWRPITT